MKTLITGLVLVAVLIGAFVLISGDSVVEESGVAEGVITEINLDSVALDGPALVTLKAENGDMTTVAIPSMGILLCKAADNISDPFAVAVGDVAAVKGSVNEDGSIVPCESADHYFEVHSKVVDESTGTSFDYRKGPRGYVAQEIKIDSSSPQNDAGFVIGYQLMLKSDKEELDASESPREGPPTIALFIFENLKKEDASTWVDANPLFSNVNLALGEVDRDAVVGGANAVRYTSDGLYQNDVVAVAHASHIMLFIGAFQDEDSRIRQDYLDLLDSVKFVQVVGQE